LNDLKGIQLKNCFNLHKNNGKRDTIPHLILLTKKNVMSIKKQFLKSKPVCKVTFKVSKEMAGEASKVNLAGEFNNWNETSDELNTLKDGSFSLTLDLETGRSYAFRYLLDGSQWINDEAADRYQNSGFNSQNSVVEL